MDILKIKEGIKELLCNKNLDEEVSIINELRLCIHQLSPFKNEPVDFVRWVLNDSVVANDYNPNKVAPPEMELLEVSIMNDGYTQPIVSWDNFEKEKIEVIDGFHRNRVGKESKIVKSRVKGYLPIVNIRNAQSSKNDRIASTIRHNRARGKHQVNAMSEIVLELKNRNWSNARVSKQLGMDEEEVLRLCQVSGLEHLFSDKDFSNAWVSEDVSSNYDVLTDDLSDDLIESFRVGNTNDDSRIFHTYDKWECHKAGFYKSSVTGRTKEELELLFTSVISNSLIFSNGCERVIDEWVYSCEHYLTNKSMNRIAWMGQAVACYIEGVPSKYSGAWFKLSKEEQFIANEIALTHINIWLSRNNLEEIDFNQASGGGRQIELY